MDVLIVGLGSIARKHIAAIRAIEPAARILAMRSSPEAASYPGVVNVYSWDLRGAPPDFIVVSNPTHLHAEAIRQSLRWKRPLFIEKPVVSTLEDGRALAPLIREAGIPTYVACNLRHLSCLAWTRSRLREEKLRVNEVNAYCGSYLPHWRPGRDYHAVYSTQPEGGGVHLDLIHELDYLSWLFGPPLHASGFRSSRSHLGIESADYAHYRLDYPEFSAAVTLNYFRRDAKRTLELVMEDRTWMVDLLANTVSEDGRALFADDRGIEHTYSIQMRYFLESLQDGNRLMNSFEEALDVLQLALTC